MSLCDNEKKIESAYVFVDEINSPDFYRKTNLKWKVWSEKMDYIVDALSSDWYMRGFTPQIDSTEKIDMEKPFPPVGDTIVFLQISPSRPSDLAEDVAEQIKDYSEKNKGNYEDALRIRSVIFETASAYSMELTELAAQYEGKLAVDSLTAEQIQYTLKKVRELHDELVRVISKIDREIRIKQYVKNSVTLENAWEDLSVQCKRCKDKMYNLLPEHKNNKQTTTRTKSRGGPL